jgi:hypothetical protein
MSEGGGRKHPRLTSRRWGFGFGFGLHFEHGYRGERRSKVVLLLGSRVFEFALRRDRLRRREP